jgi:hypothetical protein
VIPTPSFRVASATTRQRALSLCHAAQEPFRPQSAAAPSCRCCSPGVLEAPPAAPVVGFPCSVGPSLAPNVFGLCGLCAALVSLGLPGSPWCPFLVPLY